MTRRPSWMQNTPPIPEKAIQAAVMRHWRLYGVPGTFLAAVPNAGALGQPGLSRGVFDLIAIGPDIRAGFLELKTDIGELSKHQEKFRDICEANGVPAAVAYGRDEPITQLIEWGIIRG